METIIEFQTNSREVEVGSPTYDVSDSRSFQTNSREVEVGVETYSHIHD